METKTQDFEQIEISTLVPDNANARKHSKRNVDEIARSLKEFGQHAPLVVQRSTKRVLVGNGRMEAMKQLGWTHATVFWVDDDNVTAVRRAIADNRVAELAEWDKDVLKDLVEVVDAKDIPGFTVEELDALIAKEPPPPPSGGSPGPDEKTKTKTQNYVIHFDLIFDSEQQQESFYSFLRTLKARYPECETLGERLEQFISDNGLLNSAADTGEDSNETEDGEDGTSEEVS